MLSRIHAGLSVVSLMRLGLFLGLSAPLTWLAWAWWQDGLGVVPEEVVLHDLGRWGLYLLLGTIALGPAARLTGRREFSMLRRQMGLWSFTYLCLHALAWFWLDQTWQLTQIFQDMLQLRHLQLGLLGLLLLVPLAVTSIPRLRRALGPRPWRWLHRLVYVCAVLGVWHFFLVTRGDRPEPWITAGVLMLLAGFRLVDAWRLRWQRHRAARTRPGDAGGRRA